MISLFKRFFAPPVPVVPTISALPAPALDARAHYLTLAQSQHKTVLSGAALIELLGLSARLEIIRELMGLPKSDWNSCCLSAIHAFAEAVQLAPASEAHHHAFAGGLLVHTVDAIDIALRIRRKYQLPPRASAELVNSAGTRWTYGVFCAVLLHDPGKIGTAVQLLAKSSDGSVRSWSALQGSMCGAVESYEIAFSRGAPYKLHNQVSLALFATLIPESGRRWLAEDPPLLQHLTAAIYDVNDANAGAIGEILAQADGQSSAKDLGQSTPKAGQTTGAKSVPLADKYMRTLRHLIVANHFKINKPGAQLFVTKRKGVTDADSDAWIMCRAAADAIVEELLKGDKTVPVRPELVYDTLQEHGLLVASPAGRAIWNVSVHSSDWRAEFTMLRFQAWRLFGTGRVPEPFAGSVKPRKTTSASASTASKPLAQSAPQPAALQTRYFLDDEAHSVDTLNQQAPAHAEAESNPSSQEPPTANTEPEVLEQQVLLQQLFAKPSKSKPAAPSVAAQKQPANPVPVGLIRPVASLVPATASVEQLYNKVHDSHFCEDFFAWLNREIKNDTIEFNSPSAIAHTHQDGLLLVSPKVFRVFAESMPSGTDWMKVQKAVNQSGYVFQDKRRHVHAYLIKNPRGVVGKSLSCTVISPPTCKALLPPLPKPNPMIMGRA